MRFDGVICGLALAFVVAVGAAPALPQVTARQGTPPAAPEPEIVRFYSPMVLEIPLSDLRSLADGAKRKLPSVRKYVCDNDVSITTLYVEKVSTGTRKQPGLALEVTGSISVTDSYDRLVDVALRFKNGDQAWASNAIRSLSAEEERVTPFKVVVPTSAAAIEEAFASGKPTLELTLTVRDNS